MNELNIYIILTVFGILFNIVLVIINRNKEENSFFYSLSLFILVPFHIANIICLLLALGFITFVGYAIVSLLAIGQIYFIYLVLTDLFNIKITVGK